MPLMRSCVGHAAEATWSPSDLFAVAEEVVESAVDGPVHVRGRVVDTGASRGGTQFVTLVDEDVEAPTWDTPRLGLVVFAWRARWLEQPLGGSVSEALTTGTVVDAVGQLGLAPGSGSLQLRVESLAVAAASRDAAAVAALRQRIQDEAWVATRPSLPPVLRRVGALISIAGDGDLDEALRLVEHDAFAPAFCRHRIHPLSATATIDVPDLLDHHVRAGVDAVLIAFGGHLPPVSAWDSTEVLEAIHRTHRAGVPVVAGFAHGRDQPLTKLVAHNHAQASAAVTALVSHNRRLLGRLAGSVQSTVGQVEGAGRRAGDAAMATFERAEATTSALAARTTRAAVSEVARVAGAAGELATRDPVTSRLRVVIDALGDPRAALTEQVVGATADLRRVTERIARGLDAAHDSAGRVPRLLRRGFAVVTDDTGAPVPEHGPAPGSHVRVTTATTTFGATVDEGLDEEQHHD